MQKPHLLDGVFACVELLRDFFNQPIFLSMRKKSFGSFSFASVLVAATLVGFDAQLAMACSSAGSSGNGLSHGSILGAGSVTVCVGSRTLNPGSSYTQTITRVVAVPGVSKPKPPPVKAVKAAPKPASKPVPAKSKVSCPSPAQIASMPRSADSAARWVQSICSPPAKAKTITRPSPTAKPKPSTKLITETITVRVPGSSSSSQAAAKFYPNPLRLSMSPDEDLRVRQLARFWSNPTSHFRSSAVLGKQAEVHFVPVESGIVFSDGLRQAGVDTSRFFDRTGAFRVRAWVSYQVRYRLLGETNWTSVAGVLRSESNILDVVVDDSDPKDDKNSYPALLVGETCGIYSTQFGCDI